MADTHSPLEHMADLSEPAVTAGFSLAPGWWLLLALSVLAMTYLLWTLYRRWRFFAAKRQALRLLEQLSVQTDAPVQINQLLKRVLQHYQPAHPALSLSGVQWQQWLAQQHHLPLPDLTLLLYQPGQHTAMNEQLYQFVRAWLRAYRGKAPAAVNRESGNA